VEGFGGVSPKSSVKDNIQYIAPCGVALEQKGYVRMADENKVRAFN
jgi:hypothetical protein